MPKKNAPYRKAVLKNLYFSRLLSSLSLSYSIGKSIPYTTKILEALTKEGLISDHTIGESSGGRRPVMYALKPDIMYILAVAMDQMVSRMVLLDMHNNIIAPLFKFELPLINDQNSMETLAEKINEYLNKIEIDKTKIAGIGIGMPGFVNAELGINYTYTRAGVEENLVNYLTEHTGLTVFIDNDSSLIALAELRFGGAAGKGNVMVVNIGWGVGLGMILNGKLFRGSNGFAGEFSHIPLFLNGKLCQCGKTGCLETEASLKYIIEKAVLGINEGIVTTLENQKISTAHLETSFEEIVKASKRGDKFAVELFWEACYNIGRGVAILIHLMNPELIILSGRGSLAGKILTTPVMQALNENCIPRLGANTTVEVSKLGYDAELIGAAALVMENLEKSSCEIFSPKNAEVV